jgi:hypothetical protein
VAKIQNDEPNKLHDCAVDVFEVEQDHLGILNMDTDQGLFQVVINRNMAAVLISELAAFMAAEEVDEVGPEPGNDDQRAN